MLRHGRHQFRRMKRPRAEMGNARPRIVEVPQPSFPAAPTVLPAILKSSFPRKRESINPFILNIVEG